MTVVGLAAVGYVAYEIYSHKREQNKIRDAVREAMSECIAEGKKLKYPDYESAREAVGENIHEEKAEKCMKPSDTFSYQDLKNLIKSWICE